MVRTRRGRVKKNRKNSGAGLALSVTSRPLFQTIARGRAPAWIADQLVITDDPSEVIAVYRRQLQLF